MGLYGRGLHGDFGRSQRSYRDLPQGGFQSVNSTMTAEERCRIPLPGEPTAAMDMYGEGIEDIASSEGTEDVLETSETSSTIASTIANAPPKSDPEPAKVKMTNLIVSDEI
jgi:hypothetical protein